MYHNTVNQRELVCRILTIQSQLKVLHWKTESYAEHKAFRKTYETLDDLFDNIVEVCIGIHGSPELSVMKCEVSDYSLCNVQSFISDSIQFFFSYPFASPDLENLRDEVIAAFNKLKYLIRLS